MPVPQASEHLLTFVLRNHTVVNRRLSWTDIGAFIATERLQAIHTKFKQEKERMHQSEGKLGGPIALTPYYEVAVGEFVLDLTVLSGLLVCNRGNKCMRSDMERNVPCLRTSEH